MIQNILLISEAPETHQRLVRSLAAERVQVIQLQSMAAAASLLGSLETGSLAILLDVQSISESDACLLADLSTKHPGLPLLAFVTRQPPSETLNLLQSFGQTWVFSRPLSDTASQVAVLQAISVPAHQRASVLAEAIVSVTNGSL